MAAVSVATDGVGHLLRSLDSLLDFLRVSLLVILSLSLGERPVEVRVVRLDALVVLVARVRVALVAARLPPDDHTPHLRREAAHDGKERKKRKRKGRWRAIAGEECCTQADPRQRAASGIALTVLVETTTQTQPRQPLHNHYTPNTSQ